MTMKALLAAALLASVAPLHAQAPDADAMIKNVRLSATLNKMDLDGQIRTDSGQKVPISLFVRDGAMQFLLNNTERFHIRMGDEKCELMMLDNNGKPTPFPTSNLTKSIAGTNITYEDITLRFLYWDDAKLDGEERINDADCYRIVLSNPRKDGAFGKVYVWIHKQYGAFWQIRAHDRDGKPIKEFIVNNVMPLPGGKNYTVKQMRVNSLEDKGGKYVTKAYTYIEFKEPEGGAAVPKGLRK
jgi:hypothetical protein